MATSHTNLSSPRPHRSSARTTGIILGILVFLTGVALLGYVFVTARTLFDAPLVALPNTAAPASATPSDTQAVSPLALALGQSLTQFAQRLLVLLLMCIAGSVVASKGIDMFFKAVVAVPPTPQSPPANP